MTPLSEVDRSTPTILIVDDDPAVRSSLAFSLKIEGFSVRAYPGGPELLNEKDMPAEGCLVIDYKLQGMTGLDLLAELRHRRVTLPAILITTHPNGMVRQRAAAAGVPVIEKPLLTEALFDGIRNALRQGSPPHPC
jgi:two-component system, LuxR family, response regulator FixJ